MLYFAYGSNLCSDRLRERAPTAVFVGTGFLPGHDLRFHKKGRDGTGKADAYPAGIPTDRVWGALAEIAPGDWDGLDHFEPGYSRVGVGIRATGGGVRQATTYLASVDAIDGDVAPAAWYLDLVIRGARARGLPLDYIDALSMVETIPGHGSGSYDC